ncbi:hypothetical protein LTR37_001464 [Vermiconidia calcicola]|uniref:Uncharacterized protein n=1 Tax=Vermiconidia calcicola TaxID=1690605 RepID=A0ACC3NYH7_9PEZI|nr:hypothetical protein LTR37_001464 [Vermiconidia calcicola]
MTSAARQTFNIAELVEKILRHLPALQLIRIKRTTREIGASIDNSLLLQGMLFLRPVAGHPVKPEWNNLLFHRKTCLRYGLGFVLYPEIDLANYDAVKKDESRMAMYLCQPPVKEIWTLWSVRKPRGRKAARASIHTIIKVANPQGITFGDLMGTIVAYAQESYKDWEQDSKPPIQLKMCVRVVCTYR